MFRNKVIVITGSTQGIGYKTAEMLTHRGAKVVINSRREQKVKAAVKNISDQGGIAFGVTGDVTDYVFCKSLRSEVIKKFGRIDYLINNAGVASKGNLLDSSKTVIDSVIDINIKGSLYPTHALLADIIEQKGGILFISSLAGIAGLPSYFAYSGTKSMIITLAESIKNELVDKGVFIGVNYPGFTENDSQKQIIKPDGKTSVLKKRENVKALPLTITASQIIKQLEMRKFRAFSSLQGKLIYYTYRLSPKLYLYVLKVNRKKIMLMD
ncbi:3-oxoacyl-[acyl-carrier protein] reductase [Lishizhenia tianjinensis]|uniref:3-oxoacyl-[acyl-carrier protein] reductase n=1 Tax=Lishizhenia tianjinensis TaxID=477690 RepID=A0A1I6ZWK9_9FLAO|nr:SDR family oxidoreductase [Lishizhenia tianjinensis]SFT67054.1 3-oxoacyl-[acyl-carrier protein] reductase [Lishizhenia tianjinensis]